MYWQNFLVLFGVETMMRVVLVGLASVFGLAACGESQRNASSVDAFGTKNRAWLLGKNVFDINHVVQVGKEATEKNEELFCFYKGKASIPEGLQDEMALKKAINDNKLKPLKVFHGFQWRAVPLSFAEAARAIVELEKITAQASKTIDSERAALQGPMSLYSRGQTLGIIDNAQERIKNSQSADDSLKREMSSSGDEQFLDIVSGQANQFARKSWKTAMKVVLQKAEIEKASLESCPELASSSNP